MPSNTDSHWPARRQAAGLLLPATAALLLGAACSETPDTEPSFTRKQLLDSKTCAGCHPTHYRQWSGSMHAYAAIDPVFLAMNRRGQEETDGALGDFCVNCHAPMAVREGLTSDGLNLEELPESMQGVTCYFCHNVASVEGTHNNPIRLENSTTMYGGIKDPEPNSAHHSAFSPIVSTEYPESKDQQLCGPCHDIVTDSPPAPASVPLEQTFSEWQNSLFSDGSCSGCHSEVKGGAVAQGQRADRILHGHQFAAVDVAVTPFPETGDVERDEAIAEEQRTIIRELLDQTLRVDVCMQPLSADSSVIRVTLDNALAGHRFPSGATHDRRVWVEVRAFEAGENEPSYDSGTVPDGEPVDSLEGQDIWRLHDRALDAEGEPAHMFWNITSLQQRTIPAAVTNDRSHEDYLITHLSKDFPLAGALPFVPDRIQVLVRMRPIGLDVLDDLIESDHLAAWVRDRMPTYDLIANRKRYADHPTLSGLASATFEWSQAVKESPQLDAWQEQATPFPRDCVGLPRK